MNKDNIISSSKQEWTTTEILFAKAFYPLTVVLAFSAYFYLIQAGFQAQLALIVCELPVVALIVIFERLFPNKESWNKSQGDVVPDIAHNILYYSVFLVSPVFTVFVASGLFWLVESLFSREQLAIWPSNFPLVIQLILALVIAEFIAYWVHRAHHSVPLLWRLHSVHHSPGRLYWFNTGRFHLFNALFDILPVFVVLYILGISEKVFMAFLLFTAINAFFQHGNLKITIGPLNWLVSGAELHRWHHSNILEESNHNYGQNLILWDIVFGTRFLPKSPLQPSNIGMTYPSNFPKSFTKQQCAPFMWDKILKKQT
ncbi:MAG: sterol desaturase family protein [Cellvibrionaceae bacterium]